MSTGNFENWAGNIADIGPIYPFVGTEGMLAIAGVVFWIWWHWKQSKMEEAGMKEEVKNFGDKTSMLKEVSKENPENP